VTGEKGGGGKNEQGRVMKGILVKGMISRQGSSALVEVQVPPTTRLVTSGKVKAM